eukprot:6173398-Pleurochrysis_carterae.AAC.5
MYYNQNSQSRRGNVRLFSLFTVLFKGALSKLAAPFRTELVVVDRSSHKASRFCYLHYAVTVEMLPVRKSY